jgi:hypothetical protein
VVYAFLSLVMVGQGLLPGWTLSSSDGLWSAPPWTASAPDGVRPFGSNFELADAVAVFQPFFEYTSDALPDVPLWNPHIMAGRPFLADAQSAIFSPFTVPAYVLPMWKALGVIAVLKLFVGAFGMYLLGRALGMRFAGALLAGIVFAFGTFFVVWLAWPLTNIFPLIPYLLLVTELLVRRPEPLLTAALAALVGLQFLGGHPETSFHVMVVVTLWFALRLLVAWRRGDGDLVRPAAAYVGGALLGSALAAAMLLPLLEFFLESGDFERRLDRPPSHSSSRFLGALFLSDYWGRPTQTALAPFVSNRGYYAGGITLMLASVALILRPTLTRVTLAVFGLVTMMVVLGEGPLADLVLRLPGFRTAHNGRMVIFVLIVLALLAGWGLDELTSRERAAEWRRRLALGVAAALFCVPFAWMLIAGTIDLGVLKPAAKVAWALRDPPVADTLDELASVAPTVRMNALLQWLALAGAGLVLVALGLGFPKRFRVPVTVLAALVLTLTAVDLFRANMGFNPAISIDHAEQPVTPGIEYLQARVPQRFAGLGQAGALQPLGVDLAMRYGLYDARGYDYPVEKRYDTLWRSEVGPPGDIVPPTAFALPTARALRTLSLLSVSDVMVAPDAEPLRLPGLRLAYEGPDARVYSNPNALPRAFVVDRQRVVDGEDAALAAVTDPDFDGRAAAVTEERIPGLAEAAGGGGAAGEARLAAYGRDEATIEVDARRSSLVVLTDVWFPGWKASVDGREVDVERVDYLLRGVPVPAGAHTVELWYEPASWRVGWIVSLLALAGVAVLTVLGLRRRWAR